MKVSDLIAGVMLDGNIDAGLEPSALRWLNAAHRKMCQRSGCFRRTFEVGTVVAGQASYPLPAAVGEILAVSVGGLSYGEARHPDFAAAERGYLWLRGEGGAAGREDSVEGELELRLLPTPAAGSTPEAGTLISVYAVSAPPDLSKGDDSTIKVPDAFETELISGALAIAMLRDEALAGLAQQHQGIFDQGCRELRTAVDRAFRGAGPQMVRIAGVNA